MGRSCASFGCLSSSNNDTDRRYYMFPKDETRFKKWVQAIDRSDLANKPAHLIHRNFFLCDLHFQESDKLTKKLKSNAVPTLNLPIQENTNPTKTIQTDDFMFDVPLAHDVTEETLHAVPEETQDFTSNASTSQKRELDSDLYIECKSQKISESLQKYDVSPQAELLIDLQNRLKLKSLDNKYDIDFKLFILNLYLAGPLAYRVLEKSLNLPSERKLCRINLNIGTKLNTNVIKCLQSKLINLQDSEKYCIICADVIPLKQNLYYQINEDKIVGFHEIGGIQTMEPATQALVLIARGIFSDWEQPLEYCFLAESINYRVISMWLDDVISKLLEIGFKINAFVSSQGPIFMNLATERDVSVDTPYFFVNGKKIHYIFDVNHLVKSIRNNLMRYDFEYIDTDGSKLTAKWGDIKRFYELDCERAYRLAPKLTESHISPNRIEKHKVKYAAQVFSHTVAATMDCLIDCGKLEKSVSGTVKFIDLMDKTFDILNSSVVNHPNKYKTVFGGTPHQIKILDQFEQFLSNVTVLTRNKTDVTNSVKCLESFKITIKSIKNLLEDLKSNYCLFLFTSKLNQAPFESFFELLKEECSNCRLPTPIEFGRAFRKLFIVYILKHSENSTGSDDLDNLFIFMNTSDVKEESNCHVNENLCHEVTINPIIAVGTTDYRFKLPEKNAFVYVCGYLLKKCFDMHTCKGIKRYIKTKCQSRDDEFFMKYSALNLDTGRLLNPPETFVTCVRKMDNIFQQFFQNKNITGPIGNEMLQKINHINFYDCCLCFPLIYLKKLFVRFRIFNTVTFNNRLLRDKSLKRKRFSATS